MHPGAVHAAAAEAEGCEAAAADSAVAVVAAAPADVEVSVGAPADVAVSGVAEGAGKELQHRVCVYIFCIVYISGGSLELAGSERWAGLAPTTAGLAAAIPAGPCSCYAVSAGT